MQTYIDIKNGKPQDYLDVIIRVVSKNKKITYCIGFYSSIDNRWIGKTHQIKRTDKVTHWCNINLPILMSDLTEGKVNENVEFIIR